MSKLKIVHKGSKYTYKGTIYTVVDFCKIKTPEGWIGGVIYLNKREDVFIIGENIRTYVRSLDDFTDKFTAIS